MKIAGISIFAGVAMLVLIGLGSLLAPPLRELVMFGSAGVGLAIGAVGLWASVSCQPAVDREGDAGDTTLFGTYLDLWQLDHRTGEVLRRPGERQVRRRPPDES